MQQTPSISPAEVNKQFVLTKCDYFIDVQLWPLHQVLDPERWLQNFGVDETEHAVHLLNAFLFFRESLVNELFVAAFQGLSRYVRRKGEPILSTTAAWNSFIENALLTYVTGENPSPADSGFTFARKARQILEIPETSIMSPPEVLETLIDEGPRPVIFVDDFVGSGQQFVTTWQRVYTIKNTLPISFDRLSVLQRGGQFHYCPVLCTEYGLRAIQTACQIVSVNPAHILPAKYSALASDSVVWPERLLPTARDFIYRVSKRAGIPEGTCEGFHNLGLCVAFEHCVPDATLPLFYWNQNGWKPLVQRK